MEINCAGLSEGLLESELFGHERGAFTDAKTPKKGLMEKAHEGTLFLDEIGEMPLSVQAKILSAIESKSFRRVGSTDNLRVNTRIIAATNANLYNKMKKGQFREDLYYRLNVIPLKLLPLRERKEDIPQFAVAFLREYTKKMDKSIDGFTNEALSMIIDYPWPGNIRELKNIIERAVMLCDRGPITIHHLPKDIRDNSVYDLSHPQINPLVSLEEAEKEQIRLTLKHTNNNKTQAARILNIHISTLSRKMKKYHLSPC